jgi:hypothetical protein
VIQLLLLTLLWPVFVSAAGVDWGKVKKDLRGEFNQQEAFDRLAEYPGLDAEISKALQSKTDKFTAAQVAAALNRENVVPVLVKAAEQDPSGKIFSAVLSLDPSGKNEALRGMIGRILKAPLKASAAWSVALLHQYVGQDPKIEAGHLEGFLASANFEVRIAAGRRAGRDVKDSHKAWTQALTLNPYQVRLHALLPLADLDPLSAELKEDVAKHCRSERREEVCDVCKKLGATCRE